MNGKKSIEVRKNKALANAIQKLIDEYGYAEIYVYCTKDTKDYLVWGTNLIDDSIVYGTEINASGERNGNGKVMFKFRCYKVDKWEIYPNNIPNENDNQLLEKSCLSLNELVNYSSGKPVYAIHINDLEIFDKPKELSEFDKCILTEDLSHDNIIHIHQRFKTTKAPQNFCYVEVDDAK